MTMKQLQKAQIEANQIHMQNLAAFIWLFSQGLISQEEKVEMNRSNSESRDDLIDYFEELHIQYVS